MVEMGTDRIHHGFWKDMDPEHRKHVPGGPYERAILDYHVHVDGLVANLLRHADDETAVLVVSDHGAKRMDGGIRINEWLRQEGLLGLQREPEGRSSTRDCGIDWSRTKVWAEGGYYSRVFLNVEGREPDGTIPAADYERFRDELAARICAIPDEQGNPIPTKVFRPEDVYPEIKGVAPDLIVHFGDLYWRAVGTVGGDEGLHTFDNDTGPGRRQPRPARHLHPARAGRRARPARGRAPARHRADRARAAGAAGAARDARREPAGACDGMSADLSPREREVLERAAFGRSNGQIAAELGVTVNTVKFHLASIFRKLGRRQPHRRRDGVRAHGRSGRRAPSP